MPRIHVCSWKKLDGMAEATGASHVLTLMKNTHQVLTPPVITPDRHLRIEFSDILEPREGEIAPAEEHVLGLMDFVREWPRAAPLVVHCFAGVSRSTAGAFIAACMLRPEVAEQDFAQHIRAASPTATPNLRMVGIADRLMGRQGRMIAAVEGIGRGADCFEGVPFHIEIG